jgi:hypothetical protein
MKKVIGNLLKGAFKDVVADLKEEYAENLMDYYFVKYSVGTKKYATQVSVTHKKEFKRKLETILISKHDLDPTSVNYKVEYIFKL